MKTTVMKRLRIKDNRKISKDAFFAVPHVVEKVANKTMEQLEREGILVFPELIRDDSGLSREQMILQSVDDAYCSGNVMGFLGCGDEQLVVESRFSTGSYDFFLHYLLERVLDFPSVFDLETNASTNNQMLDLLVFLFPRVLQSAMRKGLFKTYIRVRYNDSNPKGTIEIGRHIKENTPFVGKVAYSQREYSYDNYLIQLVRHTIECIRGKSYGRNQLARVKDEVKLITAAAESYRFPDRQKILIENSKHPISHAYYREYRALQHLCILILRCQKQEIGVGSNCVYGILFDGAWLWEEYVATLVGEEFYHPMNKAGKGAQRLFSSANGKLGLIYPDFIGKDGQNRVVADAKYKPVGNIGNHDYFQMLAYMIRFDAKRGIYFYPETGDAEDLHLLLNKGSTYENNVFPREDICLIKHGLRIPQNAENYRAFSEQIGIAEKDFKQSLYDAVQPVC